MSSKYISNIASVIYSNRCFLINVSLFIAGNGNQSTKYVDNYAKKVALCTMMYPKLDVLEQRERCATIHERTF